MRALILFAGVCAVGLGGIFARIGLDAGTTSLTLSTWRLTIAASLLALWRLRQRRVAPKLDKQNHGRLAIAGFFLALHFLTWITSLRYVSVALSTLLVSTTPVWAGLLGLIFPALRPSKSFWLGLAASAVGVWLVTTQGLAPVATIHYAQPAWQGDLLAVAGAVCLLPYLLLSQQVQESIPTETVVAWIYGWAAVSLWAITLASGQPLLPANSAGWIGAVGMAAIPQLVGHTVFNWSLRHFSAGQVSTAVLLEPAFAGVFAWILFNERLSALQGLGAVVLLLGVAIALRRERTQTSDPAT